MKKKVLILVVLISLKVGAQSSTFFAYRINSPIFLLKVLK